MTIGSHTREIMVYSMKRESISRQEKYRWSSHRAYLGKELSIGVEN
jgi:hypothetical protein